MRKASRPTKSLPRQLPDIWDDTDCIVSDEKYDSKTVQIPNYTNQFSNILKNNKGKVKLKDLRNYVLEGVDFPQYLPAKDKEIQSLDRDIKMNLEQKEAQNECFMTHLIRPNADLTAWTMRENESSKLLASLRRIPSSEILRLLH
ncbi:unnamed protein product [Moneuplotes crassus]|uniref:Uncharacterized protein n=1 Tax=Euplotes crassus TaxID=5936 RepID=A0AAD2D745_EUPCR|nr:unnamed protein product [Moneuplotes crassus]